MPALFTTWVSGPSPAASSNTLRTSASTATSPRQARAFTPVSRQPAVAVLPRCGRARQFLPRFEEGPERLQPVAQPNLEGLLRAGHGGHEIRRAREARKRIG